MDPYVETILAPAEAANLFLRALLDTAGWAIPVAALILLVRALWRRP